jgi:hypothetical protein
MNKSFILPAVWIMLAASVSGDDLAAPKPSVGRASRVFLHIVGSPRALEYSDVIKVHVLDNDGITFETQDGFIIVHRGPFTLIGPKIELFSDSSSSTGRLHSSSGRVRFFEAK